MAEKFTIDRKNKTFVFDDGQVLPIPKDKEKDVLRSKYGHSLKKAEKEKTTKDYEEAPFKSLKAQNTAFKEGVLGDLGGQAVDYLEAGGRALSPGEGQEDLGFLDRVVENFYSTREGRKEANQAISSNHPIASGVGSALALGPEVAALGGLPGVAAFPIAGAAHSDTSILDLGEKLPELGGEALGGYLVDRLFGGLGRIAGARQGRRQAAENIEDITARNVRETERAATATTDDLARFTSENAAREAELARLPARQSGENLAFEQQVDQAIEKSVKSIGKNGVRAEALPVEEFLESISRSSRAGTREGREASTVIRSVFKPNAEGRLTAQEIQNGFSAIQKRANASQGEVKNILNEFKDFAASRLPETLSNAKGYDKIVPKIMKTLPKQIEREVFDSVAAEYTYLNKVDHRAANEFSKLINDFKVEIENTFERHYLNLSTVASDGSLVANIAADARDLPRFEKVQKLLQGKADKLSKGGFGTHDPAYQAIVKLQSKLEALPDLVAQSAERTTQKYLPDLYLEANSGQDALARRLEGIRGNPVTVPEPLPVNPAQTVQPNLLPVPEIPEPTDVYGRIGRFLEDTTASSVAQGVKQNGLTAGLASKAFGLPIGKMALGGALAFSGIKGVTSPGIAGQAARGISNQALRLNQSIEKMAQKYPTYQNGIIADPIERRSLVKEIENDQTLSLGDKALYQSKINRGQPIGMPIIKM